MAVKFETGGDRGVMHPMHPPVILAIQLQDKTKKYPAGTILKKGTGKAYTAADDADTPGAVLVQNSDGETGVVQAAFHGVCVRSRLKNASGASATTASDTLVAKLPATFWLAQAFEAEVK